MDFNDLFKALLMGDPSKRALHGYQEIKKLHEMLSAENIPHLFEEHMVGGYQIAYYGKKGKPEPKEGCFQGAGVGAICSVIETPMSYGFADDKLEISGLLREDECEFDAVVGGLTADDVFERIKTHWDNN